MADEIKKAPPVFQGVDDSGIDFQYEADVNKLCGLFYRHEGQGSSISGSGTTVGTISGTVGLDDETKGFIKDIKEHLDRGICNCGKSGGMNYVGITKVDPQGDQPITIIGMDSYTPAEQDVIVYGKIEYLYRKDDDGELNWFPLGNEDTEMLCWES